MKYRTLEAMHRLTDAICIFGDIELLTIVHSNVNSSDLRMGLLEKYQRGSNDGYDSIGILDRIIL